MTLRHPGVPTFSFLTTAYRTEHYIEATIASVLAQTWIDWELVIVDNGNSEEMAEIVGRYTHDSRIRLVRQENQGYVGGVMAAAAQARGRYFVVLDSDDHLLPDFCLRVAEFLITNPEVAAVGVDAVRFDAAGADLPIGYLRSVGIKRAPNPLHALSFGDVVGGFVPYYTAAIRADAWWAVQGYDPGLDNVDESVVIWLRLTQHYDVRVLPDKLARYRIRDDSISRGAEHVEAFEDALERSFESVQPLDDPRHAQLLAGHLRGMRAHREIRRARWALLSGDDHSARSAARGALRQRITLRSVLLLLGVYLVPGVLRSIHPVKNRIQDGLTRLRGRLSPMRTDRRHIVVLVENLSVPMDRRVWQESRALVDAGYDVTVICPLGRTTDTEREVVIDGVRILRYPLRAATGGPAGYPREYVMALAHTLRLLLKVRCSRRIDVLHACNPPDFFFPLGLLLRPWGARFVYDQHDLVPELFESRFSPTNRVGPALLAVTRMLERLTYATADGVIATNHSYRRVAIERGKVHPESVTVVRSAPDLSRFVPTPPDPDLRRGKQFMAAYLGVMGPQDGVDYALRAIAHLRSSGRDDLHTIIMGSGDEFDSLVALADSLGISDIVEFTGRVPDEFVARCLSTADVCLSPDPYNPLNDVSTMNKVVEYMAMGRPLVSFELVEARVSAGDAAIYVRSNDVAAFAEGIETLLDDPERREKMGLIGRERVENELSWESSTIALLSFYERVLARG
ncbi:glycosyltransferase [Williamsia sp. CHRR-6]|uniref:glycosyltransferase n=1 Tax=Williamsia sp. CHRR-6 TaxID=2835871 RepID=UPI001BD9DDBB|nr:glycosyltransferase [Williamsia sp. CHRR-6]MBT0566277.1 glycosyltransferase [Williamsia sp. CHRR-6]